MSFGEIVAAARAQDADALENALKDGTDIDTQRRGDPFLTPAAHLALQREERAVEFLLTHGANINYIAMSYARDGCHTQVENCRVQHRANVNYIACGYARGQLRDEGVEEYRRVYGGYDDRVEEYRNVYKANINFIAMGYALAGRHSRVEHYRKLGASANYIAMAYAMKDDRFKVEEYREQHHVNINYIAIGYAQGGHHTRVETYRELGASVNLIAQAYARGGYHLQVESYRKQHNADVNFIVMGYEIGGYHQYAADYRFLEKLENHLPSHTVSDTKDAEICIISPRYNVAVDNPLTHLRQRKLLKTDENTPESIPKFRA